MHIWGCNYSILKLFIYEKRPFLGNHLYLNGFIEWKENTFYFYRQCTRLFVWGPTELNETLLSCQCHLKLIHHNSNGASFTNLYKLLSCYYALINLVGPRADLSSAKTLRYFIPENVFEIVLLLARKWVNILVSHHLVFLRTNDITDDGEGCMPSDVCFEFLSHYAYWILKNYIFIFHWNVRYLVCILIVF